MGGDSTWYGAKAGQLVNVLASIGLTLALLRLCDFARPGDDRFKTTALLLLAMLPVYYKSFAFLRGEPLLACFAAMATVEFVRIAAGDVRARRAVALGVLLGLCILSRQWGFFLLPAFAIVAVLTRNRPAFRCVGIAAVVALLVGGWFYGVLFARYSTILAFNRDPQPGNLFTTQPPEFFTAVHARELFTSPTRGAFPNRLLPIFYAETWGDYWGYFVSDRDGEPTPLDRYLGRVNVVSILPSALLLAGAALGLWRLVRSATSRTLDAQSLLYATCGAVVLCSVLGYGWFLLRYPNDKGDTIKATYMLHVFPLLAILAAAVLSRLRGRAYVACVAVLLIITAHNVPAMITRYTRASDSAQPRPARFVILSAGYPRSG
jgi:hypothetical protein